MTRNFYAVFVAGGSGTRMGGPVPKQFLELDGVPVLVLTIRRFLEAVPEARVITVLPKDHFDTWKQICLKHELNCPQTLVAGGITRFHSVKNALSKVPDGATVSIHDGVRPLVSASLIARMAGMMETERAVVPFLKVVDSLKFADGRLPEPDRNGIIAVQTPQMFRSEDLKQAYLQGYNTAFTDDASVAVRSGIPVTMVEGERLNIKLTTPEDLVLARAIKSISSL